MKTRRGPDWSNPGQGLACFLAADPPRGAQSDPNPDAYALCLNCGKRIEHHYGGTAYRCEGVDEKEHSNYNLARLKEGYGPEYLAGEPQQCIPPGFDGGVRYYLPAELVIDAAKARVWLETHQLDPENFVLFKLSGGWVLEVNPLVRTPGALYITEDQGEVRKMVWKDFFAPPPLDTPHLSGDLQFDENRGQPTDIMDVGLITSRVAELEQRLRRCEYVTARIEHNPKPVVPTGCATIVLKYIDGRIHVLLGKRRGSHGAGEWSFPGGRLEPGEAPQERAAIELDEETGISCFAHQLRTLREQPFSATLAGGESWVTLFFVMVVGATQTAEVREPDKCFEWRWFCWDDPPTPLFGACEPIMRDVGETELKAYISTDK